MRIIRYLFITFLSCLSFVTSAQDIYNYRPLATEGKVWYFKYDDRYTDNLYYSYVIKGDTIINGTAYKKLYMQHSRFFIYTAALRDEGSRAYMVPADSTREFIYYEMELQEPIELAFGLGAKPNSKDWSGPLRIQTFLSTYLPYHTWFTWVESVGEVDDDYFRCSFWGDPCFGIRFSGNRLVSCIEDGNYIWGTGTPAPAWYEVPLAYENKLGDDRQPSEIWAEWEEGCLVIYFKGVKDDFDIYVDGHNIGTYLGPFKGNRYLTCPVGNNAMHVSIENDFERYSCVVSNVILDISTPSIVNRKSVNGQWYDLSGRPLSTPPAKGIYIRDGKKVVVK